MNEREIQGRLKKVWGATAMPFGASSRSDYSTPRQKEVQEQWMRWIELGASGVVCGDHGMGKTVILNRIREALSPKLYSVTYLTHTSLSAGDTLCALCQIQGVEPAFRRSRTANLLIESWQKEGRKPVLLVDEAQNLSSIALEELRLLLCISSQPGSSKEPITLSLCGDRELIPRLRLGINAPLISRLGYHLVLESLSQADVEEYLTARFAEVSIMTPPLEPGVAPLIHKACEGNPRKINHLVSQSILLMLAESQTNRINSSHIQNAMNQVPSLSNKSTLLQ